MPWTPLHALLGEVGNELSFEMIERAVAEGIEEQSNLDWKSALPLTAADTPGRQAQGMELAKDIAAMANSGGGMIVYGVKEHDGMTSAAGKVQPVGPIGELELRNIRQVANSLIYPPVTGLDLIRLAPGENVDQGVLVALINPSADVPHLLHQKGNHEWFQAPWRDGAETRRMTERQLSDAYRQREQGRKQQEQDFEKLYDDMAKSIGVLEGISGPRWIIGIAQPLQPRLDERRLSATSARRFLEASRRYFKPDGLSPLVEVQNIDARIGLRRFIFSSTRVQGPSAVSSRVEVHGNGALAIAFTRGGLLGAKEHETEHVPTEDIERTAKDLTALILQAVESGSVLSDYLVRVGVESKTQVFRRPDPSLRGHYQPYDESQRVKNHQPVDAVIVTQYGREQLLESAAELLTDLMEQVGSWNHSTGSDLNHAIEMNEYY